MFERFTQRARDVVISARKEAEQMGNRHVGTEHLLLAMLGADGGIAHDVLIESGLTASRVREAMAREVQSDEEALESIGIDLSAVKAKVEEAFGPGAFDDTQADDRRRGWFRRKRRAGGPFSPRSKKVLELSLREALALKHNYIGTEHILLGLLREGEGLAAKILADQGADFKALRDKAIAAARNT